MSDEEDSIFSLTPLQRFRSGSCSSNGIKKKNRGRLSLSQRSSQSKKSGNFKVPLNVSVKNEGERNINSQAGPSKRKSSDGSETSGGKQIVKKVKQEIGMYCVMCQMPWHVYDCIGKSRELHTYECMDIDFSSKTECQFGIECNEQLEQHYWNFSHFNLARARAEEDRLNNSLSQARKEHSKPKKNESGSPKSDSGFEDATSNRKEQNWHEKVVCINSDTEGDENSQLSSSSNKLFSLHSDDLMSANASDVKPSTSTEQNNLQSKAIHKIPSPESSNISKTAGDPYEDDDFFAIPDLELPGVSEASCSRWDTETVIFDKDNPTTSRNDDTSQKDKNSQTSNRIVKSPRPRKDENIDSLQSTGSSVSESLLKNIFVEEKEASEKSFNLAFQGETQEFISKSVEIPGTSKETEERIQEMNKDKINEAEETPTAAHDSTKGKRENLQSNEDSGLQGTSENTESERQEEYNLEARTEEDKKDSVQVDLDSDDDLFSSLVVQAMEKYLEQAEVSKKNVSCHNPKTPVKGESSRKCRNEGKCKPCIHLHFHVQKSPQKSPTKGGQTSILSFFQPKEAKKDNEEYVQKCSTCCKCEKASGKEAANSWKGLMSKMQGKPKNTTSVYISSSEQVKQEEKPQRLCPFYKYIPDTSFVVDAFFYGNLQGVKAYFLTHFHYDHYRGLSKKFNQPIYCSEITGRLVNMRIGVPLKFLHCLPMEEPCVVCDVEVTLLDANHCPGSVMFLFKLRTGTTVLHVGDFRAHPKMESYPELWNCTIDTLYLDTTYCNSVYDFPTQEDVIEKCVSVAVDHVQDNSHTLIVVGSYSIGKERVFKAIATALNCKIWASHDKQKILRCVNDEEICSRLTSDKFCARVHVLPMNELQPKKLMSYVENMKPKFSVVVAIRPTGWEHSSEQGLGLENLSPKHCGNVYLYGIPYSEHSSFNELRRFVQYLLPKKIIPTVNVGNAKVRKEMEGYFQDWIAKSRQRSIFFNSQTHT